MDVRVGYPTEHLASDTIQDVNHPMYSTSVGLIIKGFEQNDSNKRPAKVNKPEIELDDIEFEEDVKRENKSGFMNNLKKVFTDIFDEDDAEM